MSDIQQFISFVKLAQVRTESQKSTSTIYRDIRNGTFPAPIKIGPRAVAWTRDSIEQWKRGCIESAQKA
jgi:prophage regulatory protein